MLTLFAAAAFLMTLLGGLLPLGPGWLSRSGMWRLFSLRAGLLLSVAFTEIFPEAWSTQPTWAGWGALSAFVLLFLMESFAMLDACPEYLEDCRRHSLGAVAFLALTAHSFIDGFNLSVSYSAGTAAGAAVGIALGLHKIVDGFTLTSLLKQKGYGNNLSLAALGLIAAATPAGTAAGALGLVGLSMSSAAWLGFAAGSFIYIGAADILPRMHKNPDSWGLACFGLGLFGLPALRLF